jgi:hypothetical protein
MGRWELGFSQDVGRDGGRAREGPTGRIGGGQRAGRGVASGHVERGWDAMQRRGAAEGVARAGWRGLASEQRFSERSGAAKPLAARDSATPAPASRDHPTLPPAPGWLLPHTPPCSCSCSPAANQGSILAATRTRCAEEAVSTTVHHSLDLCIHCNVHGSSLAEGHALRFQEWQCRNPTRQNRGEPWVRWSLTTL